jgi:putative heme-binding domain-containing protein
MRRLFGIATVTIVQCAIAVAVGAAQQAAQTHDSEYSEADIVYGSRIYAGRCTMCHGPQGDGVGGVTLASGKFRNASTDQQLANFIRTGSPAAGMPPFALDNADKTAVVAYLRNMNTFDTATVKTGDAARGRAVVEGKGTCLQCHRIGRAGSRVAPNLSDIGSARSPGSLQRSLLNPTTQMMPINRPVRVVTKDGTVITGRRMNEDTYTLQVIDDRERLHSLIKTDLREYTISTTSPMPSYQDKLSSEEVADVLAYLLSLKGQ